MPITIVSYAYVEPDGTPPRMQERPTTAQVRSYLDAHVEALAAKARSDSLSPAVFRLRGPR